MSNEELLKLARQYFISDTGLSKANLIRKIQIADGHVGCFATGKTHCDQMTCPWRNDCLPNTAATSDPTAQTITKDDKGEASYE